MYHENWKDESGYKFWYGDYKWKAIKCIKKDNVSKTIEYFKKLIKTGRPSLKEFYEHAIMDLENDTSLCIKII